MAESATGKVSPPNSEFFDIGSARNVYQGCPKCLATLGMGLTSRGGGRLGDERGRLFVQCTRCGHEGPSVETPKAAEYDTWPVSWDQRDRLAFEAWNNASKHAIEAAVAATDS